MATIKTTLKMFDSVSPVMGSMIKVMNSTISSFEALNKASSKSIDTSAIRSARDELAKAEVAYNQISEEIKKADEEQKKFNQDVHNSGSEADSLKSKFMGLAGTLGVAFSAKKVVELADTMTQTTARLDLMNDGLQTTEELQNKIMASANRSRAAYQTTADAVAKMGIMASDVFNNNDEIIAFTELINKQFTIAGTSAAGIDAAMLQLTQAMASGVLRGEELNSIFEQAPTIIQSIADYLDVPIGNIREMAQEGLITAAVVGAIVIWINKMGGLKVAWLTVCNAIMTAWDWVKIGFFTGVYWVIGLWEKMQLAFKTVATNIANFMGDMKANVLTILQNMINGAISIINDFISILKKIPGVSIDAIAEVTFGTTAQLENNAAKSARNAELADYKAQLEANAAARDARLNQMKADARNATAEREAEIAAARVNATAEENDSPFGIGNTLDNIYGNTGDIAGNTAKVADSLDSLEYDISYMKDIADRESINRYTLVEVGGITNNNHNTISSDMDIDGVMEKWNDDFTEVLETAA